MPEYDTPRDWNALRVEIGTKVRVLRNQRRWTQTELAQRLGLSQARLSEIERGLGSFSAEHLLELFRLFNVDAAHFASAAQDETTQLQNALAKLGATHLVETEHVLPSDRVTEVNDVLLEVLVDGANPRHLSALAPVFVRCIDDIRLDVIASRLDRVGLAQRLGWVVDNTLAALAKVDSTSAPIRIQQQRRRTQVVLGNWLEGARSRKRSVTTADVLDPTIRSKATLKEVERTRSALSKRWGIVSVLSVNDFAIALEGSE